MNLNQGKRNKQAVSVLNKVEYDGDNPIGMTEDNTNPASCNFGTNRIGSVGRGIQGNNDVIVIGDTIVNTDSSFILEFSIDITNPGTNINQFFIAKQYISQAPPYYEYSLLFSPSTGDIQFIIHEATFPDKVSAAIDTTGINQFNKARITCIVDFEVGFVSIGSHIIDGTGEDAYDRTDFVGGEAFAHHNTPWTLLGRQFVASHRAEALKLWDIKMTYKTASQFDFQYNCEEGSGDTIYDSLGNGSDGTVVNNYAGFHTEDNLIPYSYLNEEGYSNFEYHLGDGKIYHEYPTINAGDELIVYVKPDLNSQFILFYPGATTYAVAADSGSTSTAISGNINCNIYIDEIEYIVGVNTRGDLYTALVDGGIHKVRLKFNETINNGIWFSTYDQNPASVWNYEGFATRTSRSNGGNIVDYVLGSAGDVLLPKDQSVALPPFKDVLGNDLQFKGKAPSLAKIGNSPCFQGNGSGYLDCGQNIAEWDTQNFRIEGYVNLSAVGNSEDIIHYNGKFVNSGLILAINTGGSLSASLYNGTGTAVTPAVGVPLNVPTYFRLDFTENGNTLQVGDVIESNNDTTPITYPDADRKTVIGRINGFSRIMSSNCKVWDIQLSQLDSSGNLLNTSNRYPLSEKIIDAANHTAFDIVGDNHATLVNGSLANEGVQDEFHWGQLGSNTVENRLLYSEDPSNSYWAIRAITKSTGQLDPDGNSNAMLGTATGTSDSEIRINTTESTGTGITYTYSVIAKPGSSDWIYFRSFLNLQVVHFNLVTDEINIVTPNSDYATIENYGSDGWKLCTLVCKTTGVISVNALFSIGFSDDVFIGNIGNSAYLYKTHMYANLNKSFSYVKTNAEKIYNTVVPASAALDGTDALGNPLTVTQDGKSFLNYADNTLEALPYPRKVQADKINNFLFDASGNPIENLANAFVGNTADQVFSDISETDKIKNIRAHKQPLIARQLNTEKVITNNN
jgi:hypothetical protein